WPPASARQPMEGRSSCRPPPERLLAKPRRPASDSGASVDIALLVFPTPRSSFRFRRRVYGSASRPLAVALAPPPPSAPRAAPPQGWDASRAWPAAAPGVHGIGLEVGQAARRRPS